MYFLIDYIIEFAIYGDDRRIPLPGAAEESIGVTRVHVLPARDRRARRC